MPLVTIDVIANVFTKEEKAEMISQVTEAMIRVEGEGIRDKTWVKIQEVAEGDWGIGGMMPTAEMVNAMREQDQRLTENG